MANGVFKIGPYGRYYEYTDEKGKICRMSVKQTIYTADQIDEMLAGKIITIVKPSWIGQEEGEAQIKITTSKYTGKPTKYISFTVTKTILDKDIMAKNKSIFEPSVDGTGSYSQWTIREKMRQVGVANWNSWFVNIGYFSYDENGQTALYYHINISKKDKYHDNDYVAFENWYKRIRNVSITEISQSEYERYRQLAKEEAEKQKELERKLNAVRNDLYREISDRGLYNVVDGVDIERVFDLGHFQKLKTFLVRIKNKHDAVKRICYDAYKSVNDPEDLKDKLLYMLKIYYEFNNISAKNIKSIAKFVAKYNIDTYYDDMLLYDEAIEIIIDESKDKKLLKRVLSDIAGNESKVNFLKDKSFYFEKTVRVRKDIVLINPVQLLEELKKLIPIFNINSQAAILVNIILNADESYTYQFYTYSQSENGGDMDGRRVAYMTKLYNGSHEKKIYFDYDE